MEGLTCQWSKDGARVWAIQVIIISSGQPRRPCSLFSSLLFFPLVHIPGGFDLRSSDLSPRPGSRSVCAQRVVPKPVPWKLDQGFANHRHTWLGLLRGHDPRFDSSSLSRIPVTEYEGKKKPPGASCAQRKTIKLRACLATGIQQILQSICHRTNHQILTSYPSLVW